MKKIYSRREVERIIADHAIREHSMSIPTHVTLGAGTEDEMCAQVIAVSDRGAKVLLYAKGEDPEDMQEDD